jgi:hypothetical protein
MSKRLGLAASYTSALPSPSKLLARISASLVSAGRREAPRTLSRGRRERSQGEGNVATWVSLERNDFELAKLAELASSLRTENRLAPQSRTSQA